MKGVVFKSVNGLAIKKKEGDIWLKICIRIGGGEIIRPLRGGRLSWEGDISAKEAEFFCQGRFQKEGVLVVESI